MSEIQKTILPDLATNPLPSEKEFQGSNIAEAVLAKFKAHFSIAKLKSHNPNTVKPDWECTLKKWDVIGRDSAALLLSLAEQRLVETVSSSESMSKKAEVMLSILIPFLTILIGFVLSRDAAGITNDVQGLSALISLIPICASLYFLTRNFKPYMITVPGEQPKSIVTSQNFDNSLSEDEKYYNLVLNQLGSYQKRIETNERINGIRRNNINASLFYLKLIPFAPVLAFLLVYFSSLLSL